MHSIAMINKPGHLIGSVFAALAMVGTINTAGAGNAQNNQGKHLPVGMANPASAHCQERGGTLHIITDQKHGGQYGFCQLSAKLAFEEWCWYRQQIAHQQLQQHQQPLQPQQGGSKSGQCPNMIGLLHAPVGPSPISP